MEKREKQYLIMDAFYRSMKEALCELTAKRLSRDKDFVTILLIFLKNQFGISFPQSRIVTEKEGIDICVFEPTEGALFGLDLHIRSTKGKKGAWNDVYKAKEMFLPFLCGISCLLDKEACKCLFRYFEHGTLVFEETIDFQTMIEYKSPQ